VRGDAERLRSHRRFRGSVFQTLFVAVPALRCHVVGREESEVDRSNEQKIDRFAWGIVGRKVRQLLRRPEFTSREREDLRQELMASLLERLPAFDPDQGHRYPFVTAVVERLCANLIRDRRTQRRLQGKIVSIDLSVKSAHDPPSLMADQLGQREFDARLGRETVADCANFEVRHDVDTVLSKLPEDLRRLADSLKCGSVAQAARDLGVPRTTLRERMRKLRPYFERAGLGGTP
jgi:RNA polymerase sigma factor (sigma-70 family)